MNKKVWIVRREMTTKTLPHNLRLTKKKGDPKVPFFIHISY